MAIEINIIVSNIILCIFFFFFFFFTCTSGFADVPTVLSAVAQLWNLDIQSQFPHQFRFQNHQVHGIRFLVTFEQPIYFRGQHAHLLNLTLQNQVSSEY